MRPQPYRLGDSYRRRPSEDDTPARQLRAALGPLADVREPGAAEEPILAPSVRAAVYSWLAEIRAADDLASVGLKPRGTALLYGPPGCGKTTLAHHLAVRLGIPLVIVGPETLTGKYLGESEGNVGSLFDNLTLCEQPCVLLMDELEAMGGHRAMNFGGGADNARTSTLGVMLRKIEEYGGYVIGATNREKDIDPALWRRFHIQMPIDLPGEDERFAILRRYGLPFQFPDDDLELLTELTSGASPALLRGLMEGAKRALIVGARIQQPADDPVALFDRIVVGLAPPPEMQEPPLWASSMARKRLAAMAWPPERSA